MNKLAKFLSLFFCILIISCQNNFFKKDLSKILGNEDVEIEKSHSTDEFGGFGEGYTLEIYELSYKTVQTFINANSKVLPDKK